MTTASPATRRPSWEKRAVLIACPSNLLRNVSDHAISSPQFDGRNGARATPRCARTFFQPPSEPRRGQLAPPSARIVASAASVSRRPSLSTTGAAPSRSTNLAPVRSSTPNSASRASQVRSSGEAFIAFGNTRPLEPTKVSTPRPAQKARMSVGENVSSMGRSQPAAAP